MQGECGGGRRKEIVISVGEESKSTGRGPVVLVLLYKTTVYGLPSQRSQGGRGRESMGLVFIAMDTSMVFGAAQNPVYNKGSASRVVITGIGAHIPRACVTC